MKSSVFTGVGKIEFREIPIPACGERDVLIKVAAAGICGTDVHIFHGDKGSAEVNPPVILGHELAGVVTGTGSGVTSVKIGDHVSVDPNAYCGKCHYCRIGKKQLCENLYAVGVNRDGGFAEYCAVPEDQCYLLDPEVPLRYGAMVEPLACCLHGIDRANIRRGDTVCVIGGGAIGLLMVQLAKMSGASKVILSEPVEMRRKVGLELGADGTIDPMNDNIPEKLEEYLGIPGADVVIECVGNVKATAQAFEAAKRGTTLLLFSVPKAGAKYELSLEEVYRKELNIVGSLINPDTHGRAVALINGGKINLEKIITHSYPIGKLAEAILMQESAESLKVMIED